MNVNEILNAMDDMLDSAWSVPLSGGKSVVDVDKIRDFIDDIRLNLPQEIKQAKLIVDDRKIILDDAKREADNIVKTAQEKAKRLIDQTEIVKNANQKANETIASAQQQSKELKKAANDFAETVLKTSEQNLIDALNQVKSAKSALRNTNTVNK